MIQTCNFHTAEIAAKIDVLTCYFSYYIRFVVSVKN